MIHWTPEGCSYKSGLNLYASLPYWVYSDKSIFKIKFIGLNRIWFRLVWVSVDLSTHTSKAFYLRLRTFLRPWIICDTTEYNIVENYLAIRNLALVTRELLEDFVPEEHRCEIKPSLGH